MTLLFPYARLPWPSHGERGQVVKAPVCGTGDRGFESLRSPQNLYRLQQLQVRLFVENPLAPKVAVIREGNFDGSESILRLTTPAGLIIHTVAVPQDWPSPTGPTWLYIIDDGKLTVIDAGSNLSLDALKNAFSLLGLNVKGIDRVILTHGHIDHAGGAKQLVEATGSELWAHDLYGLLGMHDAWEFQNHANKLLQDALEEGGIQSNRTTDTNFNSARMKYTQIRKETQVSNPVKDGDVIDGFTFLHTPGHSPDELSIHIGDTIFTGAHILPQITPHPTMRAKYPPHVKEALPIQYQNEHHFYGLSTYLQSLQTIARYGNEVSVMPAHRLLHKGNLNLINASRAIEISNHHVQRMDEIVEILGVNTRSIDEITQKLFAYRNLSGGILFFAYREVVAHIEFMLETQDLTVPSTNRIRWNGTDNYRSAALSS